MRKPLAPYEVWGRECGEGWGGLVQPLQSEVVGLGGTVRQIKEKFGGLRFAYRLPKKVPAAKRLTFRRRVARAEAVSCAICETCGKPGKLHIDRGYFFTGCAACREMRRVRSE